MKYKIPDVYAEIQKAKEEIAEIPNKFLAKNLDDMLEDTKEVILEENITKMIAKSKAYYLR